MIKGNICSDDIVRHVLNQFNINYVVHFAAQTHVQNSFSDAIQYTIDNIVFCSSYANWVKGQVTIDMCKKILEIYNEK